jgi:hypothetical protein
VALDEETNPKTCNGTPFDFQPEYSSAAAQDLLQPELLSEP